MSNAGNAIFGNDVVLAETKRLYFDATGNTSMNEVSGTDLSFYTGGAEKMRITSGGDVTIGSGANVGTAGTIDLSVGTTSSGGGITLWNTTSAAHSISFGDGYSGSDRYRGYIEYLSLIHI